MSIKRQYRVIFKVQELVNGSFQAVERSTKWFDSLTEAEQSAWNRQDDARIVSRGYVITRKPETRARLYLEIDDTLRWLLTGEFVRVIPREEPDKISLLWPSGERKSYNEQDPIWRYFELAKRGH